MHMCTSSLTAYNTHTWLTEQTCLDALKTAAIVNFQKSKGSCPGFPACLDPATHAERLTDLQ
eukprot:883430-Pelagomonas_calceolata.AAC.6